MNFPQVLRRRPTKAEFFRDASALIAQDRKSEFVLDLRLSTVGGRLLSYLIVRCCREMGGLECGDVRAKKLRVLNTSLIPCFVRAPRRTKFGGRCDSILVEKWWSLGDGGSDSCGATLIDACNRDYHASV